MTSNLQNITIASTIFVWQNTAVYRFVLRHRKEVLYERKSA